MLTPAHALLPFAQTGNLYVSMWTDDEVAVFSPDGVPLERFTAEGLDGPRGIAFNPANGDIWIASEFGNAIFIFDHSRQFLRRLEHSDFDEPVGVTFAMTEGIAAADQEVYISNSNGDEIMVFDQAGNLLRRFSGDALRDPNCSAFMSDGTLFVANRLGGTGGSIGAVSRFDRQENFEFDFTTAGILSLMAVARDPNDATNSFDDTVWATSGAGDSGIYEFDLNGNLLTTLLPRDIGDGRLIIPQGIAFNDDGSFYVVSFLNEVIRFDNDGNFLSRFPTGPGTSRSTAFQPCAGVSGAGGQCIPLGGSAVAVIDTATESAATVTSTASNPDPSDTAGGGGLMFWQIFVLIGWWFLVRTNTGWSSPRSHRVEF